MWYIYTTEYYPAVKKNELMKFSDKQMKLGKTRLNEVTQAPKVKRCMVSFVGVSFGFLDTFFSFGIAAETRPLIRGHEVGFQSREMKHSDIKGKGK